MKKHIALLAVTMLLFSACTTGSNASEISFTTSTLSESEDSPSWSQESMLEPDNSMPFIDTTEWRQNTAQLNDITITVLLPAWLYLYERESEVSIHLDSECAQDYVLDSNVSKLGLFLPFSREFERLNETTIAYNGSELRGYVEYTLAETLMPGTYFEYNEYIIFADDGGGVAYFDSVFIVDKKHDISLDLFDLFDASSEWGGKDGLRAYTQAILDNLTYS